MGRTPFDHMAWKSQEIGKPPGKAMSCESMCHVTKCYSDPISFRYANMNCV